ncbi:MAG: 2'-5' RNA ligase family protein [Rhodobacteraceae bacterium]|nr:2'-5' RNA ligase family protein [Paracoccaceae bacterium]
MRHDQTVIYVLTYPFFDDVAAKNIARFRAWHEPERARLVPPHITLVFGVSSVGSADLIALAEAAAQRFGPFAVEFPDFRTVHDSFEKTDKLMLNVSRGADELFQLHQALYDGPHRTEFDPEHSFQPHMTVATNPDPGIINALNIADLGTLPLTGMIEALEIVLLENRRLHLVQRVRLQKTKPF